MHTTVCFPLIHHCVSAVCHSFLMRPWSLWKHLTHSVFCLICASTHPLTLTSQQWCWEALTLQVLALFMAPLSGWLLSHQLLSDSGNKRDMLMTDTVWYGYPRWKKEENTPKCLLYYLKHLNALNVDDISVFSYFLAFFFPKFRIIPRFFPSLLILLACYSLLSLRIVLKLQYKINVTDWRPYFDTMFQFFFNVNG